MSGVARRQAPSAFNASLLDMMTCGFGAVILLFVLKAAAERNELNDLTTRAKRSEAMLSSIQREQVDVVRALERKRRENAEVSAPTVWGLPPIKGELVIVVDVSESMRNGVIQPAVAAVLRTIVANNTGISQVSLWRFASSPELKAWLDWGAPDRIRDSPLETKLFEDTNAIGVSTDLLDGLGTGMRAAAARNEPATVLLISDGMHNSPSYEARISTNDAMKRIEGQLEAGNDGHVREPRAVHVIGLFRVANTGESEAGEGGMASALSCDQQASPDADGTLRLARLLRATTRRWHGTLFGVTLPCD